MKTVNYIMVAVAVTLGFSSCYDLDVAPYDKVAQNNYWKRKPMPNRELWGYMPN